MAEPILTAEAVRMLAMSCMPGEANADSTVDIEGIAATYRFRTDAIAARTVQIERLIAELDDAFLRGRGGGWTFLNLCNDRHGRQWADLHLAMETLCVLAIAAGRAQWCLPRDYWPVLPGGMPYVQFWLGEPVVAEAR